MVRIPQTFGHKVYTIQTNSLLYELQALVTLYRSGSQAISPRFRQQFRIAANGGTPLQSPLISMTLRSFFCRPKNLSKIVQTESQDTCRPKKVDPECQNVNGAL